MTQFKSSIFLFFMIMLALKVVLGQQDSSLAYLDSLGSNYEDLQIRGRSFPIGLYIGFGLPSSEFEGGLSVPLKTKYVGAGHVPVSVYTLRFGLMTGFFDYVVSYRFSLAVSPFAISENKKSILVQAIQIEPTYLIYSSGYTHPLSHYGGMRSSVTIPKVLIDGRSTLVGRFGIGYTFFVPIDENAAFPHLHNIEIKASFNFIGRKD